MIDGIYLGDVGTQIFLDCKDDLSTATLMQIHATRPDGSVKKWTGTLQGTGISYITQAGDICQAGTWTLQSYVEIPNWSGHGDPETMIVG